MNIKYKRLILGLFLVLVLGLVSQTVVAAEVTVDPQSTNPEIPSTIEGGVSDCDDHKTCTINLKKGVYTGEGNDNIIIKTKDIRIIGDDKKSVVILDEESSGNVFTFKNNRNVYITGVKFVSKKKTLDESLDGGFISAYNIEKSFEIDDCGFIDGYATNGGAIYSYHNNE